jgi:predicted nucleic-acid-binding protein
MGWPEVKVTVDTNILVRAVVRDDEKQARTASRLLEDAQLVAVPLPCLCEFVWVLQRVYRISQPDIATAIEALTHSASVAVNRQAVDAGLAIMKQGGDFADGLIAFEGQWLGGETFASFDKNAIALVAKQGQPTKLLI